MRCTLMRALCRVTTRLKGSSASEVNLFGIRRVTGAADSETEARTEQREVLTALSELGKRLCLSLISDEPTL